MVVQEFMIAISNMIEGFAASFPLILVAIVWLFIGWLVGKVVGRAVKEILVRVKLDHYVTTKQMKFRLSDTFSTISKWIIYLIFIQEAANSLGALIIQRFVNSAVTFIFGAIEAAVLIIVGYSLATYIKDKIITAKTIYSDLVGNIFFFLIIYVSIALALPFLGIDPTLVNWILIIIIAAMGVGVALAIALGTKDVVAEIARDYAKKFKRKRR